MPSWELQLQRGVWIYMNFYLLMNGDILILCYINIQMMLTQSYLETWRNFVRSAVFWNGDKCISPTPSWRPSLDTYLHCLWIIGTIQNNILILLICGGFVYSICNQIRYFASFTYCKRHIWTRKVFPRWANAERPNARPFSLFSV